MNLTDIIALAKQGYKPGDIRELIALAEAPAADSPDNAATAPAEGPSEPEKEPEPQNAEPVKAEPDYKQLYEESQKKLAEAQKANTTIKVSAPEQKSDLDLIMEWAQS